MRYPSRPSGSYEKPTFFLSILRDRTCLHVKDRPENIIIIDGPFQPDRLPDFLAREKAEATAGRETIVLYSRKAIYLAAEVRPAVIAPLDLSTIPFQDLLAELRRRRKSRRIGRKSATTYLHRGNPLTLAQLHPHATPGISLNLLRTRLAKGWTVPDALTTPNRLKSGCGVPPQAV